MSERKLASVRVIDEINPIKDADKIEVAKIGGWNVVIQKDEYKVGDKVIYLEIDSWVPEELAPFLSRGEAKEYKGIRGNRLRSIKLRGTISQGLVLPLEDQSIAEGTDLTEKLGIIKYEPELSPQLSGQAKGQFPHFIPKTDAERIQNLDFEEIKDGEYEVTEKLDGSSCTIYIKDGELGACSRNLDLKINEENKDNAFVKMALKNEEFLRSLNKNVAIQGEVIGPKIQGNSYKLHDIEFYVFNVWDIDDQRYLAPEERLDLIKDSDINHVPIIDENIDWSTVDSVLKSAEGISKLYKTNREGLVFKDANTGFIFKAISNKWLLKNGN